MFRGVRVGPSDAALRADIAREAVAVQRRFDGPAAIRSLREVAAFQEILRAVGVNPRDVAEPTATP